MRLLATGCTGFIGRELVPTLEAAGHQLILLTRNPGQARHLSATAQLVQADTCQPGPWQDLVGTVDGVINLAGESIAEKRWTKAQKQLLVNSRLQTTGHLAAAVARAAQPPRLFLSGSAIGYYGSSESERFVESSPCGHDFLAALCRDWETAARPAGEHCRLVVLRIGIVLAAGGGAVGKMLPIFRLGFGGPIGSGNQWMSWIHRTDLCGLVAALAEDETFSGTYNAVGPHPVTMGTLSSALGQALGRPSVCPVPGSMLRMALGEGAMVVLEGQQVASERLQQHGFAFRYPELAGALKAVVKA